MSDATSTSSTARTAARCSRASTRISACRPSSSTTAVPLAESGAILWYFGEDTRFVPGDTLRPGEGAPVDVLRAVHARAGDRGRPFPRRVLRRRGQPRGDDPAKDDRGQPRARRHGGSSRTATRSSSESRSRWPTSRSTPTRTSHTKAASTSRPSRRYGRGSTASPPSPGTFPSRPETSRVSVRVQICTEPDGIAASRERPHGRREPAIRGRASRLTRPPHRRHRRYAHRRGRRGGDPRGSALARDHVGRRPHPPERAHLRLRGGGRHRGGQRRGHA